MKTLSLLLGGFAFGAFVGWFARDLARRYSEDVVEGVVLEERLEDERLVLVLRSEDESRLATFSQRREDIATLVEVGDRIRLQVSGGGVFADDPAIVWVRRSGESPQGGDAPSAVPPLDAGVADAALPEPDGAVLPRDR